MLYQTQLHTVSVWKTAIALGFTRFLFDMAYMERFDFSIAFQGFGGIRSTQPTILATDNRVLETITAINNGA